MCKLTKYIVSHVQNQLCTRHVHSHHVTAEINIEISFIAKCIKATLKGF